MSVAGARIEMHLVIENSDHFGSGTMYQRDMVTPFCPRKGDRIVLFPYESEPAYDGPMGVVKEVYWASDGQVGLDFEHFVVDPTEAMQRHIMVSINASASLHGWYTANQGDLHALLAAHGWTTG